MNEPQSLYERKLTYYTEAAGQQKRRLRLSSGIRLSVFASLGLCVYLAINGQSLFGILALVLLAVFAYLVSRHQDLKYELARLQKLIEINRTELDVLRGDFSHLVDGSRFSEPGHPFAEDLDLFGPSSFFQYLNRSALPEGQQLLSHWLTSNSYHGIREKQEAIQEITSHMDWRQNYTAESLLIQSPVSTSTLIKWFSGYQKQMPAWSGILPNVYAGISVLAGLLYVLGILPLAVLIILFFLGLLITSPYVKRITHLAQMTGKMQQTFGQYRRLVAQIEGESYQAERLRDAQRPLLGEGTPVSTTLRKFTRIIGALDQRNNLIIALFGNAFFLWDLRQAKAAEDWITEYGKAVGSWFQAIAHFDASNSLANFSFNHPQYRFPDVVTAREEGVRMTQLAHPLLFEKPVNNDFELQDGHFMVITGANMAGKSTFLRAVGLSLIMANTGLPVRASRMVYHPIPLITSMRTSDSLSRHESYFFAELKRLKIIVDHLKDQPYFVILDEILKGTNSKDKAKGSQEFLERLIKLKATGLIATHDLSLCEVASRIPEVRNSFFDVDIRQGVLHFDYRLKAGVCSNMNASFLLRQMGVVEEETGDESV